MIKKNPKKTNIIDFFDARYIIFLSFIMRYYICLKALFKDTFIIEFG
jgi:hypothetical protein